MTDVKDKVDFKPNRRKNMAELARRLEIYPAEFDKEAWNTEFVSYGEDNWCPILIKRGPTTLLEHAILMIDQQIQHERLISKEDTLYKLVSKKDWSKNQKGILIRKIAPFFQISESEAFLIFNPSLKGIQGKTTKARAARCLRWRSENSQFFWNMFGEDGKYTPPTEPGAFGYVFWDESKESHNPNPHITPW